VFDGSFRTAVDKAVKPIGRGLTRMGVTPDQLTALGLLMSVATAFAVASGHLFIGFLLLVASALPDLFDGAVAKASGVSSTRGAFFDSVADRVTDAFLLGGIGWHLQETKGAHGGRYAMLAFAVLGVSTLISYQRAKAEIYGFDAKGGLMERAERIIALAFGLAIPYLLIPVLWLMLVLVSITAVQRFVKVWKQAAKPPPPIVLPPRKARSARTRGANADRAFWSARTRTRQGERSAERSPWRDRAATRRAADPTSKAFAEWRERLKQRR
jgi:CDP-diacylglycerol---glycerol-3-phosphate 3-phosphatidyltransferase